MPILQQLLKPTMTIADARVALKKFFGYDQFRPMQAEIIESIYQKKDVIVLMPTGGGKSICFQVPAVTMDGVCVVVSPLISLMKDQVEGLIGNGIAAAFLNSSQDFAAQKEIEDRLFSGQIKLLYVSPEKMLSAGFLTMLKSLKISLFAIDEAHCISSWGHDFRPEYTQLRILREQFPAVPIAALTATADKITRRDIAAQLGIGEPEVFLASFDRPNLSLNVRPGQKRFEQIFDFLKKQKRAVGDSVLPLAQHLRKHRRKAEIEGHPCGILPRWPRTEKTGEGAGRFYQRPHAGHRGDHCLRHGHRQIERPLGHPL